MQGPFHTHARKVFAGDTQGLCYKISVVCVQSLEGRYLLTNSADLATDHRTRPSCMLGLRSCMPFLKVKYHVWLPKQVVHALR